MNSRSTSAAPAAGRQRDAVGGRPVAVRRRREQPAAAAGGQQHRPRAHQREPRAAAAGTARRPPARRRPAPTRPSRGEAGGAPSTQAAARALQALEAPGRQPLAAHRAQRAEDLGAGRVRGAHAARDASARPRAPAPAGRRGSGRTPRRAAMQVVDPRRPLDTPSTATARASHEPVAGADACPRRAAAGESSGPTAAAMPALRQRRRARRPHLALVDDRDPQT